MIGAPQLDELVRGEFATPEEVARECGLKAGEPLILMVQHPVTEEYGQTAAQVRETMEAVVSFRHQVLVVFPNNDAGSEDAQRAIEHYQGPLVRVERTLPRRTYVGALRMASVMVGNSSSGLIEAPVFGVPVVNVGTRQRDRYRGDNVIDVPPEREAVREAIARALSPGFRERLSRGANPYLSDGGVSRRIVEILRSVPIDETLLKKQLAY
jgi:UDP-hydrolysing UDP-N-acetyl-D-glucosamine 2-epimerase